MFYPLCILNTTERKPNIIVHVCILCSLTEMAVRFSIALVICLALFVLMEEVNPILAKGWKYKKLEARVVKLEDALNGLDLDCDRKQTSPSVHVCKPTLID